MIRYLSILGGMIWLCGCGAESENAMTEKAPIQLLTVDPGHFHAALVQKVDYPEVDPQVYVYAPDGDDVDLHLDRIESFNTRDTDPTSWQTETYRGDDFFDRMLSEQSGNVVVLAGNNQKKTEYIHRSIAAGLNVLADKPMVINREDFNLLKESFDLAKTKEVMLYDIMTERYEITSMLQRALMQDDVIFGKLALGSADDPSIVKESVHHFFKYVSGSILTRPPWFFDVEQEGEGIVDVTTHLVDLVQWQAYPEVMLTETDVEILEASRTRTVMTLSEFAAVTQQDDFPSYLDKDMLSDSTIGVYCNGDITYRLKDIHAKVSVKWNYKAPEGAKDTHYSLIRGSKAHLEVLQGAEQNYQATLYIRAKSKVKTYRDNVEKAFAKIADQYQGVELIPNAQGWEVSIPAELREGHEAHFGSVMKAFIGYMEDGKLPAWEVPNMITKYHTTTKALEIAKSE